MKTLLYTLMAGAALGWAQDVPKPETTSTEQDPQQQEAQPPKEAQPKEAQRSVIEVKPGPEVIKNKDLWEKTGYFHPFVRMPKYIWSDQKAIWTSPFHTAKSDIKYWAIFGAATGALIATDRYSVRHLSNNSTQVRISTYSSRIGASYSLIPLSAGFYFLGTAAKSERFRETGMLSFEAMVDTFVVSTAIKTVTNRARPLDGDGNGGFFSGTGGRWNSGFPSGHAINTWALASIFAHQYPRPVIVPIIVYGLASTVVISRVGARQHFPGDAVAGAAMGWFIGDFVYGRRHNTELDPKRASLTQKLLSHVRLGGAVE